MTSFLILIILLFTFYENINAQDEIDGTYTITEAKRYQTNNQYIIKKGIYKYLFYSNDNYLVGEKIFIKGNVSNFEIYYTPGAFNSNKYYRSQGVYGIVKSYEIKKINKNSPLYSFKRLIKDPLLKVFLGVDSPSQSELINELNIYYLISLSGLHIYFLLQILDKLMFSFNIEMKQQDLIKIVVVMICLVFSGFKTTILRIVIYQLLKFFKSHYYNNITNFTLMNLSFLLVILIRPYLMFNLNYLITYLIVSSLLLFKELISSNNFIISQIKTNLLINLVVLPFFSNVNILTIVLSPIYYLLIVNLLFPLSIINNFCNSKIINKINSLGLAFLESTNTNYFNIKTFKLNKYLVLIYLIILLLILISKNYQRLISVIMLMLILITPSFKRYVEGESLYFLDVGQGDSSVYISNDLVIVIDCYRNVSNFLDNQGIKSIDYLIITHNDLDHVMELEDLVMNFKIKNIIVNPYSDNVIKSEKVIKANGGMVIKDKNIVLKFLSPEKNYENENNNSLVFKLKSLNFTCLFTGDIGLEVENDLVLNYGHNLKSDYLKVAHHGSETSSSLDFLNYVNAQSAIISVGRNNHYNLPSEKTINNLNLLKIDTFRTDISGTITINSHNKIFRYKK